jgi:hypothetical protein
MVSVLVSVADPATPTSLLLKQLGMEARVGLGLKTPQSRDKITHFQALLKRNRPLLVHCFSLQVDARFDARDKVSHRELTHNYLITSG